MLLDKQKNHLKIMSKLFFHLENCDMLQIIFRLQNNIHTIQFFYRWMIATSTGEYL